MCKKSYLLAGLLALVQLMPLSAQAAKLNDLFTNAEGSEHEFLSVEQAFSVQARVKDDTLTVEFNITPGHYTYRDKLKVKLPEGIVASKFNFNQPEQAIDDPEFGKVVVFDQPVVIATAKLTNNTEMEIKDKPITVRWQGCAKAGLCYPPQKIKLNLSLPSGSSVKTGEKNSDKNVNDDKADNNVGKSAKKKPVAVLVDGAAPNTDTAKSIKPTEKNLLKNAKSSDNADNNLNQSDIVDNQNDDSTQVDETVDNQEDNSTEGVTKDTDNIEASQSVALNQTVASANNGNQEGNAEPLIDADPFGLAKHPFLALGLLFLAGLGLALTPCVLPMLPIVANIVARQENPSVKKGVMLTSGYAFGVATAYGILGALIAIFGQSLGIIGWLQNPVILISFAVIFVILALYMMDLVPLRLPSGIQNKMQNISQAGDSKLGSVTGSFIAGALSALVVSPCVSAPLFGALIAVSTIGSPVLGFMALFMLGLGLSAPLILLGATQGNLMPKAGEWMNWVKQGFALLLLAVALLLVERVFISPFMLLLWALWFMIVATWAWSWAGRGQPFSKAVSLMFGIWAGLLIVGASMGNDDNWQPLAKLAKSNVIEQSITTISNNPTQANTLGVDKSTDKKITTLTELDEILKNNPKTLVDVTADWCIECRIMEKTLFTNRPNELSGWQVVKLDVTESTPESKAVLEHFKLFGPPSLLYYKDGNLVGKQVGEIKRAEFEKTLSEFNQ